MILADLQFIRLSNLQQNSQRQHARISLMFKLSTHY